jgi:hypothetical protein
VSGGHPGRIAMRPYKVAHRGVQRGESHLRYCYPARLRIQRKDRTVQRNAAEGLGVSPSSLFSPKIGGQGVDLHNDRVTLLANEAMKDESID